MGWKFWQKNKNSEDAAANSPKLPKPKELPEHMGMHLVVKEKLDPDWVWSLKCAKRPHDNNKHLYDFRIFNESDAAGKGLKVVNYDFLNDHPDLILYQGQSDKRGYEFQIKPVSPEKAA